MSFRAPLLHHFYPTFIFLLYSLLCQHDSGDMPFPAHPYSPALLLASQHQACSGSPSGHLPRWQAAQDVWAPQKVSGWRCSVPQSFYSDPRLCPTLWDRSWSWMALPPTPRDPVTGDDNIDASLQLSAVALMDAASSVDYDLEMRWGNGFLSALALHTWRIHKTISLLSWSLRYSFWNDWHSLHVLELCYRTLQFSIYLPHTYPVDIFYIEHSLSSICLTLTTAVSPICDYRVSLWISCDLHIYNFMCFYDIYGGNSERIYIFFFPPLA